MFLQQNVGWMSRKMSALLAAVLVYSVLLLHFNYSLLLGHYQHTYVGCRHVFSYLRLQLNIYTIY